VWWVNVDRDLFKWLSNKNHGGSLFKFIFYSHLIACSGLAGHQWYFYTPPLGGEFFTPSRGGVDPTSQLRDDTALTKCNVFCFLMFKCKFVLRACLHPPQTFVHTPPNFKFLEITLLDAVLYLLESFTKVKYLHCCVTTKRIYLLQISVSLYTVFQLCHNS